MIYLTTPLFVLAMLAPAPDGARFGRALLTLGDLDGDGVSEIAVGAPAAALAGLEKLSGHRAATEARAR